MLKDYFEIKKFTLITLIISQAVSFFAIGLYNPYTALLFGDDYMVIYFWFETGYGIFSSLIISACALFFILKSKSVKLKKYNYLIFFNILLIIYCICNLSIFFSCIIADNDYFNYLSDINLFIFGFYVLFIPAFYKYLKALNETISNQYNYISLIIIFFTVKAIVRILLFITVCDDFENVSLISGFYNLYYITYIICNFLYITFCTKAIEIINIISNKQKNKNIPKTTPIVNENPSTTENSKTI